MEQIFSTLDCSAGRHNWKLQGGGNSPNSFLDVASEDGKIWARIDSSGKELFFMTSEYKALIEKR
jgi:hypothetical protein